jgi:hypothetical protein
MTTNHEIPGSSPGVGLTPPSLAQLVERLTVEQQQQPSNGRWFDSGSWDNFRISLSRSCESTLSPSFVCNSSPSTFESVDRVGN